MGTYTDAELLHRSTDVVLAGEQGNDRVAWVLVCRTGRAHERVGWDKGHCGISLFLARKKRPAVSRIEQGTYCM